MKDLGFDEKSLFSRVLRFLSLELKDKLSRGLKKIVLVADGQLPVTLVKKDETELEDCLMFDRKSLVEGEISFLESLGDATLFLILDGIDDYMPFEKIINPFAGCSCCEEVEMRLTLLGEERPERTKA